MYQTWQQQMLQRATALLHISITSLLLYLNKPKLFWCITAAVLFASQLDRAGTSYGAHLAHGCTLATVHMLLLPGF